MDGIKYDENKTDWTLAPWPAFEAVIRVMMFGERKYTRDNWRKVTPPRRYIAAAFRHLSAWCDGEHQDPETGFSHLWHAGCCIIFCIWLEKAGLLKQEDVRGE